MHLPTLLCYLHLNAFVAGVNLLQTQNRLAIPKRVPLTVLCTPFERQIIVTFTQNKVNDATKSKPSLKYQLLTFCRLITCIMQPF